MRISAVVIVYNLEEYVREAIDSVMGQTRPADEIIVIDDCSNDGSANIVKSYGDKVRYIKTKINSGALSAALCGVKAANGDIVCMLDGDDYWHDNKLEIVEDEFSSDPDLMLLSHDHVRVDSDGRDLGIDDDTHRNIRSILSRYKNPIDYSDKLKDSILEQRGYWLGSAYSFRVSLFNISIFEKQISKFNQDLLRGTYLDLVVAPFLVLTNANKKVGYTSRTKFFYRIHDKGSVSGNFTPEKAIASALKAKGINELINLILIRNCAKPSVLKRREMILLEYDYISALYGKDALTAARLYAKLAARHWSFGQLKKETKRMVGVAVLGPERFLVIKNRIH